jgi:hypothetical protein
MSRGVRAARCRLQSRLGSNHPAFEELTGFPTQHITQEDFTNRANDRLQRRGIQNVIRLVRFRFKSVNPGDCIVQASNEACQPLWPTYAPHQKDHRRVVAGLHDSLTKGLDRQGTSSDTGFRYRRCKYEVFLGVGYQTRQALLPRIHTRKPVCRKQTFEGAAHQKPLIGTMSERPIGSGIHGEHAKTSAITSFGLGDRGVSGLIGFIASPSGRCRRPRCRASGRHAW